MIVCNPRRSTLLAVGAVLIGLPVATGGEIGGTAQADSGPYRDDPRVVAQLESLAANSSVRLEGFKIAGDDLQTVSFYREHGPRVRDYSTKMVYAPERRTALYCGASHNTPVVNDVWEYLLGSNTWQLLYASDGGRQDEIRASWRIMRGAESKLRRGLPLSASESAEYNEAKAQMRTWYREHVSFDGGYIHTARGGPVYPSHTWDGLTYDPRVRRLLWHPGHDGNLRWYAEFTGQDYEALRRREKPTTKLWMYEPATAGWQKQVVAEGTPQPPLRGMGATLQYIPELGKSIFYVAVDNVAPPAMEMWSYDARANRWEEIRPNGGKRIGELATAGVAPRGEVQVAYSPKQQTLVALADTKAWTYEVPLNRWSVLCEDAETRGFHGRSVFVYDPVGDVFLLVQPGPETPSGKRLPYVLRVLTLETGRWRTIEPNGPPPRRGTWWPPAGYYDPDHNVLVTYNTEEIWVYRFRKADVPKAR